MSDDAESQDRTGAPTQTALSLREAAELVGKDRTTLQKALKRKGISTHQDESGKHWIEPSELFRVYPHAQYAHAHSSEKSQASTWLHSDVHTVHAGSVHATAEVERLKDELAREREERSRERQQLKEHLDDLRRRLEASEEERRKKDTQLMALLTDQREKVEKKREEQERQAAEAAKPRGFLAWLRGS
jgi:DNA repair exonuclease SbcCD ATPase subunit